MPSSPIRITAMLRLASMATFRNLDRPLGLGITWGGYLNWARDEIQAAVVRANAEMLASSFPVQWLGAQDIARLSPELRPGPVSAALFSAIDGHLDPVHVTRCFLDRAVDERYGTCACPPRCGRSISAMAG